MCCTLYALAQMNGRTCSQFVCVCRLVGGEGVRSTRGAWSVGRQKETLRSDKRKMTSARSIARMPAVYCICVCVCACVCGLCSVLGSAIERPPCGVVDALPHPHSYVHVCVHVFVPCVERERPSGRRMEMGGGLQKQCAPDQSGGWYTNTLTPEHTHTYTRHVIIFFCSHTDGGKQPPPHETRQHE